MQFVKFANIEEDTPSYHLRYDFFVSKFASLCHNSHDEVDLRNSLRIAGLRGIQVAPTSTFIDETSNLSSETSYEILYDFLGN